MKKRIKDSIGTESFVSSWSMVLLSHLAKECAHNIYNYEVVGVKHVSTIKHQMFIKLYKAIYNYISKQEIDYIDLLFYYPVYPHEDTFDDAKKHFDECKTGIAPLSLVKLQEYRKEHTKHMNHMINKGYVKEFLWQKK